MPRVNGVKRWNSVFENWIYRERRLPECCRVRRVVRFFLTISNKLTFIYAAADIEKHRAVFWYLNTEFASSQKDIFLLSYIAKKCKRIHPIIIDWSIFLSQRTLHREPPIPLFSFSLIYIHIHKSHQRKNVSNLKPLICLIKQTYHTHTHIHTRRESNHSPSLLNSSPLSPSFFPPRANERTHTHTHARARTSPSLNKSPE